MDNEFLTTPLLTDRQKKKDALADSLSKAELVKGLQSKNNKLRQEIARIQNAIDLSQAEEKNDMEKTKKRHSIIGFQENEKVIKQQLQNAYKKIKMYEYEVNKIEQSQSSASIIQQTKKIQGIIKEKKAMSQKLKKKFAQNQKKMNENIKNLHNNSLQMKNQSKVNFLSNELKFLREKQKEQLSKEEKRANNLKKQHNHIKNVEKALVEGGITGGELEEIKQKAIRKVQVQNIGESGVSKNLYLKDEGENQIVDRTKNYYESLLNEIKVLEKLESDHEKKIYQMQLQKLEAVRINNDTRDRLLEIQDQIEKLHKETLVLRGKVIPSNMKPLRPLRSVSSHQMNDDKSKKLPKNMSINKGGKSLLHPIKFDEVGMTSVKGQRFTDRNLLGKTNLMTKITSLTVYIKADIGVIAGMQCIYGNKKKGGEYFKKDKEQKEKQYKEQTFSCEQKEFIKSVSGTLTPEDKLQSIYVISSTGRSHRFGEAHTIRKSFNFDIGADEAPVCIFGSLINCKETGKKEYSIIQHFGVQIFSQQKIKKSQPDLKY